MLLAPPARSFYLKAMRAFLSALALFLSAALPAAAATPGIAASAIELAAHHAVYDLTLGAGRGGVVGASGRMTYDVIDACSAWAVQQRLELDVASNDGSSVHSVSDYTTWESKDGRVLRFRLHEMTGGEVTTDLAGEAHLDRPGGAGMAVYTRPRPARVPLPAGTFFPMAQNRAIIAAAIAGKRVIAMPLFDGTNPDGAQNSTVALARWGAPYDTPWPGLKTLASGRVHIGFFDRTPAAMEPSMQVGMRYFANGVADGIALDFGDFMLDGRLVVLDLRPARC